MAIVYTKPAVRHAWADTAAPADISDPGDTSVAAGWTPIGIKPQRQFFNWVLNYAAAGVRYLCQRGIATYDATETYSQGSMTVGPDGLLYQSLNNNNTGQTPASSPSQWGPAKGASPPNSDNSNAIATTAWAHANLLLAGSPFSVLSGTVANAQVPVGAVTQYQGNLHIAFTQLTGSIANGQVPLSAISQWQGNLAIGWGQITGTKNADQLNGVVGGPLGGFQGNTYARYDASGFLYAAYHNQGSPNNENPNISQVMVTNGGDNFMRKASVAALKTALGSIGAADIISSLAQNGFIKIPTSSGFPLIIQFGQCNPNGGTLVVTMPTTFPHQFNAVIGNSTGLPTACNCTILSGSQFQISNTGGVSYWIAIGW